MKNFLTALFIMISTISMGCNPEEGGFRSVTPDEFQQLLEQSDSITVLDSRTAQEYAEGHIRNSVNIDVTQQDFLSLSKSQLNKNNTIAVYCRSGRRSKRAAEILTKNGFTVVELDCGITCWIAAGKEIVR